MEDIPEYSQDSEDRQVVDAAQKKLGAIEDMVSIIGLTQFRVPSAAWDDAATDLLPSSYASPANKASFK
jgi:hypothetical protein